MVTNDEFDAKAKKAIPAEIHVLSGCQDMETPADVSDVGQFKLPNAEGQVGGACTAAFLQILYAARESTCELDFCWVRVLGAMRQNLKAKGFDYVPQLTSSRLIDVKKPCKIVNPNHAFGTKRAVLIGINYTGQDGELTGCHNDVRNMKVYLETVQGFQPENILILIDDGVHSPPTKIHILNAYRELVRETRSGDTVFCHYSGHGGWDKNIKRYVGEVLIPVDFRISGHISEDDLLQELIKPMPSGTLVTFLIDCCHGGTVLELPYHFTADGNPADGMQRDENTDFDTLLGRTVYCCFGLLECMYSGDHRVS